MFVLSLGQTLAVSHEEHEGDGLEREGPLVTT